MEQKRQDTGTDAGAGTPDSSSDGVLKDLAAQAAALAPALSTGKSTDPRRRGEITFDRDIEEGEDRYCLYIDGELWAELDYCYVKRAWCIQDCMGQCLSHVEHIQAEVPDEGNFSATAEKAINKAKEMIRDGSMPSPEDARKAFNDRYGSK